MELVVVSLLTLLGVGVGAVSTLITASLSTRGLRRLAYEQVDQQQLDARLAILREMKINQLLIDSSHASGPPVPLLISALSNYILNESGDEVAAPVAKAVTQILAYNSMLEHKPNASQHENDDNEPTNAETIDQRTVDLRDYIDDAVSHLGEIMHYEQIDMEKQRHERLTSIQTGNIAQRWRQKVMDKLDPGSR